MAALAVTTISCQKGNNNAGDDEGEKGIAKPTYRITKLLKSWEGEDMESGDMYKYTWNADGTISKVEMAWAKAVYATVNFAWSGKTVTVTQTDDKGETKPMATITVNDQKLATKIEQSADTEIGSFKLLECTYDNNGFLTVAKVEGKVNTVQVIDEDGNIEWWGRIGICGVSSESTSDAGWRKKIHTYYSAVNAAGIHGEWDEDVKVKRWFYETGLVGRASAHVMRTAWWWGVNDKDKNVVKPEYATSLAYYPLDVDENSCVKTETKCYDEESVYKVDPSKMKAEGTVAFVCEKIK